MNEDLIFETDRLILKPMTEEDANGLYELLKDVYTSTCFGNKHFKSVEEAKKIIGYYTYDHTLPPWRMNFAFYGIFEKASGKYAGCLQVYPQKRGDFFFNYNNRELGYAMLPEFRGKGYVTEAVNGMVEFLMENLWNLEEIEIAFFDWNEASRGVARKSGFYFDHTTQQSYHSGEGNLEDEEHWTLTRGDYEWRRDHSCVAA